MKKHIKVHAKLIEGNSHVLLTLLECSHFDTDFGSKEAAHKWDYSYGTFLSSSGVRMYYINGYDIDFAANWLVGIHKLRISRIGSQCKIPIKHWPRIKAAIQEYNEWGESQ